MKIFIIAVLSLISIETAAQIDKQDILPFDSLTHKITYSEWIKIDDADSSEIYNKATAWLLMNNDSMENVSSIVKGKGKLSFKGFTWLTVTAPAGMKYRQRDLTRELLYTIKITVKNGGCQFTIGDFHFHHFAKNIFYSNKDSSLESMYKKKTRNMLRQIYFYKVNLTAKNFAASLKSYLETQSAIKPSKGGLSGKK